MQRLCVCLRERERKHPDCSVLLSRPISFLCEQDFTSASCAKIPGWTFLEWLLAGWDVWCVQLYNEVNYALTQPLKKKVRNLHPSPWHFSTLVLGKDGKHPSIKFLTYFISSGVKWVCSSLSLSARRGKVREYTLNWLSIHISAHTHTLTLTPWGNFRFSNRVPGENPQGHDENMQTC